MAGNGDGFVGTRPPFAFPNSCEFDSGEGGAFGRTGGRFGLATDANQTNAEKSGLIGARVSVNGLFGGGGLRCFNLLAAGADLDELVAADGTEVEE